MKTISLRFSDNLAPEIGTIAEHEKIIESLGFVWYGKFGPKVSASIRETIMSNQEKKVLLIHSGTPNRYWLYVDEISYDTPNLENIPEYYRHMANTIKTWFRVNRIEKADKNVLSHCLVSSSGRPLSEVSRASMNPYFIIDFDEGV